MIKVLIVEDEIPAQINLKKLIDKCCDQSRIVMTLSSVRSTIKWLEENPEGADVIFLDVELSDGICFDIFDKVDINAQVIITTAYDNYAINAFRINSVDYLLKPIVESDLSRAWERCKERMEQRTVGQVLEESMQCLRYGCVVGAVSEVFVHDNFEHATFAKKRRHN